MTRPLERPMWKPDGYPTLSSYLITPKAAEVMRFLEATLGAERLRVFENEDGSIMHAEVRIDDSVVMIGEAGGDWSPVPSHVHVYVEDVDAAYRAGKRRPERRAPGSKSNRRGGVLDPGGNTWWLAAGLRRVGPSRSGVRPESYL